MSNPSTSRVDAASFRVGEQLYRYLVVSVATPELPELTAAEREVLVLVRDGLSNGEIAERRRTSVNTVGNQIAAMFKKLGVASRYELIEIASQLAVAARRPA
jgi:DNA-binding NarL/FixJ family response regulator